MIFTNLKNGCKRACNLVKNSRAVRFCALVAVCLTFNVATALADSGAGAKNYYVDGVRGEVKKIALPRNLVSWE